MSMEFHVFSMRLLFMAVCEQCSDVREQLFAFEVHPSGMLRNLLVVPRTFDFLSKHKKLMGSKGLRKFLKAGWCLMHTGLGFLTAYGGTLATTLSATSVISMTACCRASARQLQRRHKDARWLHDDFSELGLLVHQNSCSCLEPWDPWTMM